VLSLAQTWSIHGSQVASTTVLLTGNSDRRAGTSLVFNQAFENAYGDAMNGAGDLLYAGGGHVTRTGH